ncbi:MAG: cell division/cell wall cluster transcriptional repressor MraZ [Armatimonadota bacterium]|nr:cell division/cell wall cluster transcriptional repressor MraZ [Armatimonadota bacterium]MDW8025593.1 cell division/cell wall cluster transcriptional repressor MraZ [Armatimonadota bacterium]
MRAGRSETGQGSGIGFSKIDFSGHIFHALDDKYRLVIPQQFRDGLGRVFRVVISSRDTLYLVPSSEWEKLQEQLSNLEASDPARYRAVAERMRAFSAVVEVDRNWRVLIPKELRERARLTKNVVSIGQGNRVELMDREVYEKEVAPQLESEQTKRMQRHIGW